MTVTTTTPSPAHDENSLPGFLLAELVPLEQAALIEAMTQPPQPVATTPPALCGPLRHLALFLTGAPLAALPERLSAARRCARAALTDASLTNEQQAAAIKAAVLLHSPEVENLSLAPWAPAAAALPPRSSALRGWLHVTLGEDYSASLATAADDLLTVHQLLETVTRTAAPAAAWLSWPDAAAIYQHGKPASAYRQPNARRIHHHRLIELDPYRSKADLWRDLCALLETIEAEQRLDDADEPARLDRALPEKKRAAALQALAVLQVWGWPGSVEQDRATVKTCRGEAAWRDHSGASWQRLDSLLHRWQVHPAPNLPPLAERAAGAEAQSLIRWRSRYQGHAAALLQAARTGAAISTLPLPR